MEQEPAATGYPQTPVVSVHASVVHGRPSLQVLAVVQVPELAQVPQPAAEASSQRTPVRGDHADVLEAVAQYWHVLAGSTAKDA